MSHGTGAALASGCCLVAGAAFVPGLLRPLPGTAAPAPSLRGASAAGAAAAGAPAAAAGGGGGGAPWLVGALGALGAGALVAAGRATGRRGRGGAAAARQPRGQAALQAVDPKSDVGVTAPLGFFDPLRLSEGADEATYRWYRAAELKNGRVAMLAALGGVVQHFVHVPGFEQVPSGLGATLTSPGAEAFAAVFLLAGALEAGDFDAKQEPGNFGDPAGLNQYTVEMRNRELNNGRFAMFAAVGILAAELASGKDAVEQWGLL